MFLFDAQIAVSFTLSVSGSALIISRRTAAHRVGRRTNKMHARVKTATLLSIHCEAGPPNASCSWPPDTEGRSGSANWSC